MTDQTCKTCQNTFEITQKDLDFYARLEAPTPEYCPSCRMQRRLAQRNERTLYRRQCDMCHKDIVAVYPANTEWPVYCSPCFNSDKWDSKSFAMDYDPAKPFLRQFAELQKRVPRVGLISFDSVNSEYTNNSGYNKNCYLLFAAEYNEDSMYGRLVQRNKFIVDGAWLYDSELCYECLDCRFCYNCLFCERSQNSSDLLFCFSVRDSRNCILCTNLHHAQYCIENKQCTKEEYERKKKEILASHDSIEVAKKRFEELKSKTVVKFAFQTKCEDATGDYLHNCHEVKRMFDSTSAKACAFSADGEEPIDCYDCNNFYYKCELCLDMMGVLTSSRSRYSTYVFNCSEIEYCDNMTNCNSCFGCIGMKKRDYYILNKQYTPEKYRELRKQIVESMKKEGLYGSFLPPSLSPFGYNEVLAKDYFPLTREEALARGFKWQDKTTGTSGKETIKQIPATMAEVDDKILNEVLVCEKCRLNFKITPAELAFYRKMGLPLPHFDFECRHQARLAKRNPRQLWTRQCLCDYSVYKNLAKHDHHPTGRCPNKFETSYAPDKPGIVYCEQCYQAEVV